MENQNQRNNEETEIDLVELFWVLWRKLPLMIAVGLFTALLAFGGSKFLMTPTYQSVTKIYVLNKQDNSNTNVTYSDLQAGTQLVKDYSELIKSRFVLEAVIEQLGLPLSYEKLSRKVIVQACFHDVRRKKTAAVRMNAPLFSSVPLLIFSLPHPSGYNYVHSYPSA